MPKTVMKIRVKIEATKGFPPNENFAKKFWIYLPDGQYFCIFKGHVDLWYQMYAQRMDYPSQEAAITAALQSLFSKADGRARYQRVRAKERLFRFKPDDYTHTGKWIPAHTSK